MNLEYISYRKLICCTSGSDQISASLFTSSLLKSLTGVKPF